MSELKIIRVFAQGESSTMQKAYDVAKYQVKFQYSSLFIVEYEERSITDIVNLNLSETDHIKWLLEKDGCIINCHPFQADFPPVWNYNYFLSKLKEEATAKGIRMFPNPDLVDVDPTFSQDKFGYIEPLQSICIPSLKVHRNGDLTQAQRASISAFAKSYYEIRGKHVGGWIIKAPFSTNSKQIFFCKAIRDIFLYYGALANRPENICVPYFIVQPYLANRKEYKVCILSDPYTGEVTEPFLCVNPRRHGKAFISQYDHKPLFEFAKLAKRMYEEQVSKLVYPVFRVDIMTLQNGKLVVNEFESLEADIYSATRGQTQQAYEDSRAMQIIQNFWYNEIIRILGLPLH